MNSWLPTNWVKICLLNLSLVAIWGVLMRYKIAFEFPYIDQKNFQLAHSNFAFSGWISLLLMVLMVKVINDNDRHANTQHYQKIFLAYLISAWGMLISFSIQGYGIYSIGFNTASILITFWFCITYYNSIKQQTDYNSKYWFIAALAFNIISTFGTFYLDYIMFTHSVNQYSYLSSFYWLLHFQYNGWFFFACAGLFIHYLQENNFNTPVFKRSFWIFALSCIPAYGLSILWLNIPVWIYIIIVAAAIMQFIAWIIFLIQLKKNNLFENLKLSVLSKLLLIFVATALSIKLCLQLGSTIPFISKLAFGFRPIVIAYLHLVLLAFTTVFLLTYLYICYLIPSKKTITVGLTVFVAGIFLNELVLSVQGIASLSYTVVPFVNELLLGIALIMLFSIAAVSSALRK